jgi:hypothetical protein
MLDPEAFGRAVAAHTFPDYNRASPASWVVGAIDRYWARAWRRARARQVKAAILTPGGAALERRPHSS